ncbi:hypothetical protein K3X13_00765 [Aliiroseovarius crassostreae]|uniref:hypothetical protein n=1 Tax=Aliiroseovarius TaxID=1658781 RepID=UPI001567CF13|nr:MULTISPECIES: hypothetical protein [Aliiroseovarius]UWP89299.1 hypothetical protein K3J57_00870 [Aliiroseovarius crassostreae]UWP92433.1 hypothetical protein K3X13_00765 [Aliiroseovarius crassostreae]UWP98744.1 hypothetical protein K3X53_00800 [Aliiroseovarius crassostreae]
MLRSIPYLGRCPTANLSGPNGLRQEPGIGRSSSARNEKHGIKGAGNDPIGQKPNHVFSDWIQFGFPEAFSHAQIVASAMNKECRDGPRRPEYSVHHV